MPHKLLLADDSVTIQRVIELTFADEDVQLTAVGDGRQAIAHIEADPPDIVLADVGMPEKDGYEVAAFIKNNPRLAHIPVLLLTGAFEPVDEDRARAVGCDGVLAKPFEPQMVITRVKELLAEAARPSPARRPAAPPASLTEAAEPGATSVTMAPTMVPTMLPVEAAAAESEVDTATDEPVALESPLDAAVRIRRRPTLAIPDFGVPPVEAPAPPLRFDVDPEADTPVPGRRSDLDDYFRQLEAPFSPQGSASLDLASVLAGSAPDASEIVFPPAPEPAGEAVLDLAWATQPFAPATPPALADDTFAALPPPLTPRDAAHLFEAVPSSFVADGPVGAVEREPQAAPPAQAPAFAQAFSALLAAESGEGAPAVPLYAPLSAPSADTDALVAQVTRQVLEQLSDRVVRETVTDIVSRIAERLVREEIERVRAAIR